VLQDGGVSRGKRAQANMRGKRAQVNMRGKRAQANMSDQAY
jgi:hypothetical protein